MPFGPWNLWPDMESMSMFIAFTSSGIAPTACTASVWKSTLWALATLPISAMGSRVPISLLAAMIVIRMVLSVMAASTCSGVTRPSASTGR